MKYYLQTFWCQMNIADSEKINMIMLKSWFFRTNEIKEADVIILNTCSVRKKWEDKVYSLARDIIKIHKQNWTKCFVWLTWCMVRKSWIRKWIVDNWKKRIAAKEIENLKSYDDIFNSDDKIFWMTDRIDFVFRIEDLTFLPKILSVIMKKNIWNDETYNEYLKIKQLQDNPWSANIVIQTGCDNFCSYCIVPHTRWREKSRDKNEIINEIKETVAKWTKEIYLIWQNVNSYSKESRAKLWNIDALSWNSTEVNTPFRELLNEIDKIDWLDRIRFTSSNPHDMTKDILDAHFNLNKTCNYLHFALQSWDNEMLKKMNRKHTYEDFKSQVEYLRNKDPLFSISTDIIVGFPWETEEQFLNTLKAFDEINFDFAYIARYSPRKWTYSADKLIDDVSAKEKARRWHILNNKLEECVKNRSSLLIWTTQEVLVQGISKSWKMYWRTRNFKEVYFDNNPEISIWDIVTVKIDWLNKWVLEGSIINR